jgi:hypothetical protein
MARFLALLFLLLLAVASMCGQDTPKREVFGVTGIGKTYDDEGSLGKGLHGGGGFGYRFTRRFGAEIEATAFRTRREFPTQVFEASGAMLLGNGLLHLTGGRVQWYLLGGAGLLYVRNNLTDHGLVLALGTGVKIYPTRRFVLRPEVRLFAGNSGRAVEAPFTGVRVSMGAGFCW